MADEERSFVYRFREEVPLRSVPPEAASADISRRAVERFQAAHEGIEGEAAEAQIRRLLEDLLGAEGGAVSRGKQGDWALRSVRPSGYSLLLSRDGCTVIGYATTSPRRTYETVKREWQRKQANRRADREAKDRKAALSKARVWGYDLAQLVADARMDESEAQRIATDAGVLGVFQARLNALRRKA